MPSRRDYDLLPRSSSELTDEEDGFSDKSSMRPRSRRSRLSRKIRRTLRICRPIYILLFVVILFICQLLFNGSYLNPKPFKIDPDERVFIAANIVNEDLIRGDWGRSLKGLVDLIGEDKVFVSVFGSPRDALEEFARDLKCENKVISEEEEPIELGNVTRTKLPTGDAPVKRIAFLAEVRNRALEPLRHSQKKYDKVLFVNDVVFNPMDAARLLWGTNVNEKGRAEYKAACAADFITSWKYYDTFATRDTEGYSLGVPIFPWFTSGGDGISRKDVLAERDAVRLKSCWGGMVAFNAQYFQGSSHNEKRVKKDGRNITIPTLPLRFRFEDEAFWDASECCLIHADIMAVSPFSARNPIDPYDTGIYMNPFVRVAYSQSKYKWIKTAQRFERLFALPQLITNHFAHMPYHNPRRTELEGEIIPDRRWVPFPPDSSSVGEEDQNHEFGGEGESWQGNGVERRDVIGELKPKEYWEERGFYEDFERVARRGGYCGTRQLLVINEDRRGTEVNWDKILDKMPAIG